MKINVRKHGDWMKFSANAANSSDAMEKTINKALKRVGQVGSNLVKKNIRSGGKLAGKPFQPLSSVTIQRKGGLSSPLIENGDLLDSISFRMTGKKSVLIGPFKAHRYGLLS